MVQQHPRLVDRIVWSDESHFTMNGRINRHNCWYWSSTNQHHLMPIPDDKDDLMVWVGMYPGGILAHIFLTKM